jgi:hypothetical protein
MAGQDFGMIVSGRQTAPPHTEAVLVTSACRSPHEANSRGSDAHRAVSGRFFQRAQAGLQPVVALAASAFLVPSSPEVSPA